MGDSDDDYDKGRRRDKFQSERRDYGGDNRSRQYGGNRGGYYDNRPQRGYQRGSDSGGEPQQKRMRQEWGDNYDPYDPQPKSQSQASSGASAAAGGVAGAPVVKPSYLMTFKQFLGSQDDSITDEEAILKYQDYKLEFKRQELHKFFIAHKDEEWFRLKYLPVEADKQKNDRLEKVRRRLEIFQELREKGLIDRCSLDQDNTNVVLKGIDALVVRLEGGTYDDVAKLDEIDSDDESVAEGEERDSHKRSSKESRGGEARKSLDTSQPHTDGDARAPAKDESDNDEDNRSAVADAEARADGKATAAAAGTKDNNEDGALSDSGSEKESEGRKTSGSKGASKTGEQPRSSSANQDEAGGGDDDAAPTSGTPVQAARRTGGRDMLLHRTASIFLRNIAPAITMSEIEQLCKRFPGYLRVGLAEPLPERKFYRRGWVSFKRDVNIKEICWNLNNIRLRDCDLGAIVNRDLTRRVRVVNGITVHRNVAQADLRLAARLVQIYDKKAGLWQEPDESHAAEGQTMANGGSRKKHMKLMDLPPGAHADFGIASNNPLLENITDYLIEEASAEEEELLGQGSAAAGANEAELKVPLERDDKLLKVLDRIILYLRLVHSVDYYNHGEYPHEDEMPNRCGLIHVRGVPPPQSQWGVDESGRTLVSQQFINEFIKNFEARIKPMLDVEDKLSEAEVKKLGKKDPEKEVEAFVTANCQELAKDKWLCPLSGKKFKGPEFVRKHIFTKHIEKLDEVRTEVEFFSNYLYDPKRPSVPEQLKPLLPSQQAGGGPPPPQMPPQPLVGAGATPYDHPPPVSHHPQAPSASGGGGGQRPPWTDRGGSSYDNRSYAPRGGGYNRSYGGGNRGGGYQNYGQRNYPPRQNWNSSDGTSGGGGFRGTGRRDPREPITYKDLDAPEDVY